MQRNAILCLLRELHLSLIPIELAVCLAGCPSRPDTVLPAIAILPPIISHNINRDAYHISDSYCGNMCACGMPVSLPALTHLPQPFTVIKHIYFLCTTQQSIRSHAPAYQLFNMLVSLLNVNTCIRGIHGISFAHPFLISIGWKALHHLYLFNFPPSNVHFAQLRILKCWLPLLQLRMEMLRIRREDIRWKWN